MSFSTVAGWGAGVILAVVGAIGVVASPVAIAQDADLIAPHNDSGVIGELEIGQAAEGKLAGLGEEEASSYHTYTLDVPAGTQQLVVEMSAEDDLDLGIKHELPISQYGQAADWDLGDDSYDNSATLTVKNPKEGTWYIDVINSLYTTDAVPYELSVK